MIERENKEKNQAGTKDLTSSSKFSACTSIGKEITQPYDHISLL